MTETTAEMTPGPQSFDMGDDTGEHFLRLDAGESYSGRLVSVRQIQETQFETHKPLYWGSDSKTTTEKTDRPLMAWRVGLVDGSGLLSHFDLLGSSKKPLSRKGAWLAAMAAAKIRKPSEGGTWTIKRGKDDGKAHTWKITIDESTAAGDMASKVDPSAKRPARKPVQVEDDGTDDPFA